MGLEPGFKRTDAIFGAGEGGNGNSRGLAARMQRQLPHCPDELVSVVSGILCVKAGLGIDKSI
jgi:hypothetical protein